jgi:hypothetical protein
VSGECLASSAWARAWASASAGAWSCFLESFSCAGFGIIGEVCEVLGKRRDEVLARSL